MVEEKEFAILFKRNNITESITEFIPYRVIEGKYIECDAWFMDTEGIGYLHIAEPSESGIAYGGREILKLNDMTPEEIEKKKEELLEYYRKYRYIRDMSSDYHIIAIDKEKEENHIYADKDTAEIYKRYESPKEEYKEKITMTPEEIKKIISETIKGQDKALEKITTAIWMNYNLNDSQMSKKNMLIIGPTGVGKTAIFDKLKEILNVPISIIDAKELPNEGYPERIIDEIILRTYCDCENSIAKTEKAIVVLDEIDALIHAPDETINLFNIQAKLSTFNIQDQLLKMLSGYKRTIRIKNTKEDNEEDIVINTSKMLFVFVGTFDELFDKNSKVIGYVNNDEINKEVIKAINEYGMSNKLLSRLPIIVELNSMNKEILKDIILNSNESELKMIMNVINSLGITINNPEEVIDIIIDDAMSKGIGARGITLSINDIFLKIFYEIVNNPGKYKELIINKDILKDKNAFTLIEKKTKKRVKTKKVTNE